MADLPDPNPISPAGPVRQGAAAPIWKRILLTPPRWALAAAVLTILAVPIGMALRNQGGHSGDAGLGAPGEVRALRLPDAAPILLAPRGRTAYRHPVFLWLPAPGNAASNAFTLTEKGGATPLWKMDASRSPLAGVPELQPGKSYHWQLLADGGEAAASVEFSVEPDAAAAPPAVPASVDRALALAEEAGKAGRPADGVMLLALLPPEWRADERVRSLRLRLTEESGAAPKQAEPEQL